ncbi:MaoC/PaaZ C-terminal domain-containing protein [Nocardioides convexus]|uniref:MaoC family dehydratase n=1 Tax=Nocardioides convexus TaxID=2712224 RepID=UPI002418B9B5|nr:MaoC/PaaZ C-terminal domain-containing protein [Nocardioides convexus]
MGMVHLDNAITQHRRITFGETLSVVMSVGEGVPHPAGTIFLFKTAGTVGDELVWEETSAYLSRGRRNPDAEWPDTYERVAAGPVTWRLPANLGRKYGAVSGDINPIHLSAPTAKALGFKRQIAHGYWTMARSVAAIDNRLPSAVKVEASFRKPTFLPSTVAFGYQETATGSAFSLTKAGSDTIHLLGRTTNL